MGGSSSQLRTNPAMSPLNAFPIEDLYTPEFSESLQGNTGYWQEPNPHETMGEQVVTSPTKKKQTCNRQNWTIQTNDVPRQIAWTTEEEIVLAKESGDASINMNTNVVDEDEVQEIRRPGGRDKARAAAKNKGSKAPGSSTMNDDALARLMVTETITQEKAERLAFMEIKRREVECHEREVATQEYRAQQEDIRFYLQPYDHLTGDQRLAMDEARAKIKAKYNLHY
ncbi:hypothetical protein Tco_1089166 [Tanacetum coccineum]